MNDIAIIKLKDKVELNNNIQIVNYEKFIFKLTWWW
jgi:hypothetical protein